MKVIVGYRPMTGYEFHRLEQLEAVLRDVGLSPEQHREFTRLRCPRPLFKTVNTDMIGAWLLVILVIGVGIMCFCELL